MSPMEFLAVILMFVGTMVFLTYYGYRIMGSAYRISSFDRARMSTIIGVWTFLFIGMFIGIFAMIALYMGELSVVGWEWLFGTQDYIIALLAFVVAFSVSLGYLYIYRGGA